MISFCYIPQGIWNLTLSMGLVVISFLQCLAWSMNSELESLHLILKPVNLCECLSVEYLNIINLLARIRQALIATTMCLCVSSWDCIVSY